MKILITGGTGSFGTAFIDHYHKEHELTVFSRDEFKQSEMRPKYPNVRFEIGDIRDRARLSDVMQGQDYAFHAAALKQVPSCELHPFEAVKTNILGAEHVIDTAQRHGVKLVCLSTDKAVYPINSMGVSKAMMEKLAIAKGAIITRYGNVMKSRGSIIPIWEKCAAEGRPLPLTHPEMTRFLLSLRDSIDLVMYAMEQGEPGDIFVKKAPACSMLTLARAISDNIEDVGIRAGEKLHETLIGAEEMHRTDDMGDYFRVRANDSNIFMTGPAPEAYSSFTTNQLNVEEVRELINATRY